MSTDLTSQLAACEARIETHLQTVADMAAALREIRDKKLYTAGGYDSWAEYVSQRWNRSDRWARLIVESDDTLGQIRDKVPDGVPPPSRIADAAALAGMDPAEAADVWTASVSEAGGGTPTAKTIRDVRRRSEATRSKPADQTSMLLGGRSEFVAACRSCKELLRLIATLGEQAHGSAIQISECRRVVNELIEMVQSAEPHALCSVCRPSSIDRACKICRGRGFITKGQHMWGPKK